MKIPILKLFGNQTPHVWSIEVVHGCNLRCGHCSEALNIENKLIKMDETTWLNAWNIIKSVCGARRVDLCVTGEPTLHDDLLAFLSIARKICPYSQIQITTNGTQIYRGKYSYKELLDAGANIIYVDTYDPVEEHKELAIASGYPVYEYYKNDIRNKSFNPWFYQGPHIKAIVLQLPPDKWPKSRFRAGLLGTWYNHLDWEKAKKYGLKKVEKPLSRRCNQPFLYATIAATGEYLLCCQDGVLETAGKFGSVNEKGIEGFKEFWFSEYMQFVRKNLREKNRGAMLYCSRCCVTWSRCDFKHWTDEQVNIYYKNKQWYELKKNNQSEFWVS